jgi:hypothetical protein
VLVFLVLRSTPSDVAASDLDARLASGSTTVVELYSNF